MVIVIAQPRRSLLSMTFVYNANGNKKFVIGLCPLREI